MPSVTQRTFIKGVDGSTSRFDQPRNTLPRLSNLIFTRRGSLVTVDGTKALTTPTNKLLPTAANGSIVAIQQFLTGIPIAGQVTPSGNFNSAGSGTDQAVGGSVPWANPGNVTQFDTIYAVATAPPGPSINSDYLIATGFNFNIPLGATIHGIDVGIWRVASATGVTDLEVKLVKGGVVSGTNHAAGGAWPTVAAPITYANPFNTDMWGLALTPADVNAANFGCAFRTTLNNAAGVNGGIDIVQMNVWYTGGAGAPNPQTGQSILYLQDPQPGAQLAEVTGLVAADAVGGILIPTTTYTYKVVALDGRQNATAGVQIAWVLGGGKSAVQLTWNAVPGAGSYLIFGDIAPITNASNIIGQVFQPDFSQNAAGPIGGPTVTFTDLNGAAATLNNVPYGNISLGSNQTIGAMRLFIASSINPGQLSYYDPIQLAVFPCRPNDSLIPNNPPLDASGHLLGGSCPIPQMIQFANKIIIALGNGLRPQSTDGVTVTPFTNTFTALYITWLTGITYLVGDIIRPVADANNHTPGSVDHYYKCTQAGLSGAAQPTFPTVTGQAVTDNQASWVEAGLVTTSPPPRGAAHVAYHAGSLWFLNTAPVNSSDNLDGPSILGMSDANNVISFNPINRAFVGKDDGSEGMGLASFTIAELGIAPLGSLIVFKDFSTYQVVGVFGSPNFTIQQVQTNMGCTSPRSIQFLAGFGLIRMSHLGFAIFDGVRDKLISESIRPFIFGSPAVGSNGLPAITGIDIPHLYLLKGDQFINPPMYVCGAPLSGNISLNRLFLYDLVLKGWAIVDLPSTIAPTSYLASIYQARTPGIQPLTMVGGFDNGSIQVIQNGSSLWNLTANPATVNWAVTTPEIFNTGDPSGEVQLSTLIIRGTNPPTFIYPNGNPITVTLNLMTESGYVTDPRSFNIGPGEFELFIGINETVMSASATISGTGIVELESFSWNVIPKPTGIPSVIT